MMEVHRIAGWHSIGRPGREVAMSIRTQHLSPVDDVPAEQEPELTVLDDEFTPRPVELAFEADAADAFDQLRPIDDDIDEVGDEPDRP